MRCSFVPDCISYGGIAITGTQEFVVTPCSIERNQKLAERRQRSSKMLMSTRTSASADPRSDHHIDTAEGIVTQPVQSAPAIRRHHRLPQGSAVGIAPMMIALLVLSTLATTVSGRQLSEAGPPPLPLEEPSPPSPPPTPPPSPPPPSPPGEAGSGSENGNPPTSCVDPVSDPRSAPVCPAGYTADGAISASTGVSTAEKADCACGGLNAVFGTMGNCAGGRFTKGLCTCPNSTCECACQPMAATAGDDPTFIGSDGDAYHVCTLLAINI